MVVSFMSESAWSLIESAALVLSVGANVVLLVAYQRARRQNAWIRGDREKWRRKWMEVCGELQETLKKLARLQQKQVERLSNK